MESYYNREMKRKIGRRGEERREEEGERDRDPHQRQRRRGERKEWSFP